MTLENLWNQSAIYDMLYQLFGDGKFSSFSRSVLLPESAFDMIKTGNLLVAYDGCIVFIFAIKPQKPAKVMSMDELTDL